MVRPGQVQGYLQGTCESHESVIFSIDEHVSGALKFGLLVTDEGIRFQNLRHSISPKPTLCAVFSEWAVYAWSLHIRQIHLSHFSSMPFLVQDSVREMHLAGLGIADAQQATICQALRMCTSPASNSINTASVVEKRSAGAVVRRLSRNLRWGFDSCMVDRLGTASSFFLKFGRGIGLRQYPSHRSWQRLACPQ